MSLDAILDHVDGDLENSIARLMDLMRIESISTDPQYSDECVAAAEWLVDDLISIGFDAEIRETPGHPMVMATGGNGGTHTLFYGHYDVQPIDPIELWNNHPFKPKLEETKKGPVIRGRGASDDKGQLMTFIEACRAYKEVTGKLPNMVEKDTPSIVTMLRGMVSQEITIKGPSKDLHSGMYGGPSINPIRVLTRALGAMHDDSGRVTLEGFYEGVEEIPEKIMQQWNNLSFDENTFLSEVGLKIPAGEKDRSVLEQVWSRPTAEINGIWGGYTGEGFKTVLPSEAHAKVSFRLVGKQNPDKIQSAFNRHLEKYLPEDCTLEYKLHGSSMASNMAIDNPSFEIARNALSSEWENSGVYVGCGGSIPIAGHFQKIIGLETMLIGFAQDDDSIHSPNEKYDIRSFHKGIRSWVRILHALA